MTELQERKDKIKKDKNKILLDDLQDKNLYIKACEEMYKRIGRVSIKVNHYSNETIDKIPMVYKGNRAYSKKILPRILEIQEFCNQKLKVENVGKDKIKTNAIFLTLTKKYNPKDEQSIKDSWNFFHRKIPTFQKWLKRNGMNTYIYCLEAHSMGGCHSHFLIFLEEEEECIKYKYKDNVERYRVTHQLKEKFSKYWGEHISINGVSNTDIARYITKELLKCNQCELALKHFDKGYCTNNDKKHLYTFYFAKGKKNFNTSQDVKLNTENLEITGKDNLFKHKNKSDIKKQEKTLEHSKILSSYKAKVIKIKPLTETIDEQNSEYKPLKNWLYADYSVSNVKYKEVFKNKNEIEINSTLDLMLMQGKKEQEEREEIYKKILELEEIEKTLDEETKKIFEIEKKNLLMKIGFYKPSEQEKMESMINGLSKNITMQLLKVA